MYYFRHRQRPTADCRRRDIPTMPTTPLLTDHQHRLSSAAAAAAVQLAY